MPNILSTKTIRDLKKIGLREKVIILSLLSITFLIGLGIPLLIGNLSQSSQTVRTTTTPSPQPAALLLSSVSNVETGKTFDVIIKLNSSDVGIEAGDFILYFDPQYLKPQEIKTGNYFQKYPVKKIDKNFIKISASASFINNKIILPKGEGIVATVIFKAVEKSSNTLIYFDPDHTIVASNGQNILNSYPSLTLSVN